MCPLQWACLTVHILFVNACLESQHSCLPDESTDGTSMFQSRLVQRRVSPGSVRPARQRTLSFALDTVTGSHSGRGLLSSCVILGIALILLCYACVYFCFSHKKDSNDLVELRHECIDPCTLTFGKNGACVKPALPLSSAPNAVHTNRFSWLTWLPKSLYIQFHRIANVYFVLIATLACTPLWGGKWAPKVALVSFILLVQALKDAYEDSKLARDDRKVNSTTARRYNADRKVFEDVEWQYIAVGDILLIEKSSHLCSLPADMLILASSESSGLCYLSTKSLDGETNLKEKHVPTLIQTSFQTDLSDEQLPELAHEMLEKELEIALAPPQASLEDMKCSMKIGGAQCGLSVSNFALRGCTLQNTRWTLGAACYVGEGTKLRLNSARTPSKRSALEALLNQCVTYILVGIFSLSIVFAVVSQISPGLLTPPDAVEVFVKYLIILYCVLPMTLYVAFEFLHLFMGYQIDTDPLMWDSAAGLFAKTRNTSVIEDLGQVEFVFSDKTGTLTANELRFASCCIGTTLYDSFLPPDGAGGEGRGVANVKGVLGDGSRRGEVYDFFESLALCHTVRVGSEGTYEAESPDEAALVQAAASVGLIFENRQPSGSELSYVVRSQSGASSHLISQVLPFSSDRKRMSVVCPNDQGAVVITKGADNVMEKLLSERLPHAAQECLDSFSRQGLRTLVVARHQMSSSEYASFQSSWDEASAKLEGRDEALAKVAAMAEVDMKYVGVTALEDKLQEGVPETIVNLRAAGIRVWVLTGDKVETAVEIAHSCKLFDSSMELISIVQEPDAMKAQQDLEYHTGAPSSDVSKGLILDGSSVTHILSDHNASNALYDLATTCNACVCCRLSPLQKRELVDLVQNANSHAITLAIGDGANDVPMIQGAHIGIGIHGKEGSASIQASDFAIAQFKFLGNLTFCHGRKAYRRLATFLCFFIYRSVVIGWCYTFYASETSFSGRMAYPDWLDLAYSALTTCAAVLLFAFDTDFEDAVSLRTPDLYKPGPSCAHLNTQVFATWMLSATLHGIMAWCIPIYATTTLNDRMAQTHSYWKSSFVSFSVILIIVHLKLFTAAVKPMNAIGVSCILLEMCMYIPVAAFLGSSLAHRLAPELTGVPVEVLTTWRDVVILIFVPLGAIAVDLLVNLLVATGEHSLVDVPRPAKTSES